MRLIVFAACCGGLSCGGKESSAGPELPSPQNPATGSVLYESGSIKEEYQFYLKDGEEMRLGAYSAYYESGVLSVTGFFVDGLRDSLWTYYDESGRKMREQTWREGQCWNGPVVLYWPNGNLSEYGTYREGKWHGSYQSYYEDGTPQIQANYAADELNGPYVEYYENGEKRYSGFYRDGLKDGMWSYFTEAGLEVKQERYADGVLLEEGLVELEYYEDGTLKSVTPMEGNMKQGLYVEYWENGVKKEEITYIDDVPTGRTYTYWDNGQIRDTGSLWNGKKQGLWLSYRPDGALMVRANYEKGVLSGPYVSYYFNGNAEWEGSYDHNRKDGLWINYDSAGEKRLQQLWDQNALVKGVRCADDPAACEG